jgi:UDP-2-acetamido-3-amino-2,3-dideoxy-glucuronate N-acetyltransferase
VCGATIGRFAFIAAGAVITKDVPAYALMMGVPARQAGWMSRHGYRLEKADGQGIMVCHAGGLRYQEKARGVLVCLDQEEESPLPRKNEAA